MPTDSHTLNIYNMCIPMLKGIKPCLKNNKRIHIKTFLSPPLSHSLYWEKSINYAEPEKLKNPKAMQFIFQFSSKVCPSACPNADAVVDMIKHLSDILRKT